ncbi:type IV secretion system protein [Vibrio parahaemolyticus]|uniref:type IV secretion system protein n=1 Tax=Vibrio parahaemolyticus TaxID=670 RepID=UPI0007A04A5F|nr:type IV secretion system protein [Vibrio parahaemolyticus]EGQ8399442.1 type IV secretion system protein VirB6 [Vibrio parahaemolyticus]EGQ9147771.1 type IV secretion system protein VirB6 [Vibrio parahaemolyticus]EGR0987897.1 type IV secretion system protein [Vibrio parahaemolyticus]EGR1374218.1 type IV secretion system protein [Vibrio parahaemolyticus]EHY8973414.1 type IV secretion system protein [Vibrio parahaemolyticus]
MDIAIFQYISGSFEFLLQAFVVTGSQNIMDGIKPIVYTCVTIYIMAQAYVQIMGKTDDLAIDVLKTCLIVLGLSNLTLNTGNYTEYIIGGVEALGNGLAGAMAGHGEEADLYQTLDALLQVGVEQMNYCFSKAGWDPSTWMWLLCGIVVMLAIGAVTVCAAVIVLGTKFLLAMLLVVGPIFIIMACFPPTRRFLDNWLSKVFENILVQVFAVAIIMMMIRIMRVYISENNLTSGSDANPAAIIVQIAVIAAIQVYVLRQIPNLAGSLAGGFASAMLTLPKINAKPNSRPNDSQDRIQNRQTWTQQQQNQISGGGAKTGTQPKNDLSQDLRDRIAEHNLKNK